MSASAAFFKAGIEVSLACVDDGGEEATVMSAKVLEKYSRSVSSIGWNTIRAMREPVLIGSRMRLPGRSDGENHTVVYSKGVSTLILERTEPGKNELVAFGKEMLDQRL